MNLDTNTPAVQVKERECYQESLQEPAESCDVAHIEPWAAGGLTIDDNGRPACGWHNLWRQRASTPR